MFKKALFVGLSSIGVVANANVYNFSVTNGGNMPISPGVLYTSVKADSEARVGANATAGFVKLCQTGMNADRAMELKSKSEVKSVMETAGPILPGETRVFEVEIKDKNVQGVHFETMYGKTKDICGVISANRHNLAALNQHVVATVSGNDQVLLSGAFSEPAVSNNADMLCSAAKSGVECLRALSSPKMGVPQIRSFNGYLPSLLNYLEAQYGAEDVQTLLIPTAGAIRFQLELKH